MISSAAMANLVAWSLQVLCVVAAGGALPWLLRLHAPAVRHLYWRLLLAACLMLPLLQPWPPSALDPGELPVFLAQTPSSLPVPPLQSLAARTPASWLAVPDGRWRDMLATLLIGGAGLRLAWLGLGLVRLRQLRRAGQPPRSAASQPEIGSLAASGTDVRYVEGLRQPVTFGVLSPVVLLPQSLTAQPPEVRRAVLVHELWHVRRRDWLWVLLEETVRAILWFHPAVSWLVSRIQSSREEVVDELTVLATNARRSYLEALLVFADEPGLFPATPFARRHHLVHRMLLISREAVMSSRRIVASCAAMGAIVVLGGWYGAAAFPLRAAAPPPAAQAQPRDLRPGEPRPASNRETEIRGLLTTGPQAVALYIELARLQEARGANSDAVTTLQAARAVAPGDTTIMMALAGLQQRSGQFAEAASTVEEAAAMRPSDASAQHLVASFYEEKVRKDSTLSPGDRLRFIQAGVAAEDRALALTPDYVDALVVKNILLRHQANQETSRAAQAQLIADADQLRNQAIQLQRSRQLLNGPGQPAAVVAAGPAGGRMPPPPPPGPAAQIDGQAPVRVGGNIAVPVKIRNVPPVYPLDAQAARVQGVIIIEATVDAAGNVRDTRVLRSIPMLDQAAVDAVGQWQFAPTLLNGQPVPVIMTVTVNFTLQ